VEARSRAALLDSAPYHWRHTELARGLVRCGVPAARADLLALSWLQTLAADAVKAACARAPTADVRAALHALPGGLDGARDDLPSGATKGSL
jgi:hypothetical protein